jgi:hypothetical protein
MWLNLILSLGQQTLSGCTPGTPETPPDPHPGPHLVPVGDSLRTLGVEMYCNVIVSSIVARPDFRACPRARGTHFSWRAH